MRTLLALALVLLAIGCADRSSRPDGAESPPTVPSGPDAVVLRVPRGGGTVVAYAYPRLDTVVWRSSQRAPALAKFIAFGAEDGYLAATDTAGAPVRIDLRLGTVLRMRGASLAHAASADGGAVYVVNANGELTRFTPSGGDWKVPSPLPASALLPQVDGSLIAIGDLHERLLVWRVRPPNDSLSDSVSVKVGSSDIPMSATIAATAGTVGNRIYVGAGQRVIAVNTRDLSTALNVDVDDDVRAIVFTPSGDRVFVSFHDKAVLRIVDRFEEGVAGSIRLTAPATSLRMDPLGRTVLARTATDSVTVVSVADGKLRGTIASDWREDLPLVLADGRVAVVRDKDIVLLHGSSLAETDTVKGGSSDTWYALRWNGFRPRAAGLDAPVEFRRSEPRYVQPDSTVVRPDSANQSGSTSADSVVAPAATGQQRAPEGQLYTVSFAALLNERQAQELARQIKVEGASPRVVTSDRDGKTIFRVILGPYRTRADAERAGRASGSNYWVYEGAP